MLQACKGCGAEFETMEGGYAADGSIVCAACAAQQSASAEKLETKNAGSAFVGAWGSVLIALLSFIIENRLVFFLFPLVAIAAGGGTAWTALTNQKAKAALGWKRIPTVVIGILGLLLALLSLSTYFTGDAAAEDDFSEQT
ncbi:MAG TPA: hypothetical protein VHQ87_05700, partial [Rhizobacter sp.]|nr:hypothetical protein [Rhizobacter sp.]